MQDARKHLKYMQNEIHCVHNIEEDCSEERICVNKIICVGYWLMLVNLDMYQNFLSITISAHKYWLILSSSTSNYSTDNSSTFANPNCIDNRTFANSNCVLELPKWLHLPSQEHNEVPYCYIFCIGADYCW